MLSQSKAEVVRRALDAALRHHSEVLELSRSVEAAVESRVPTAPGNVARKLGDLAERVASDGDRYHRRLTQASIPELFPDLRQAVATCEEDREQLAVKLHGLVSRVESASDIGLGSEVGLQIRETIAAVRRYEAAETRLLRRALAEACEEEPTPRGRKYQGRDYEVDHAFLLHMLKWLEQARHGALIVELLRDLGDYLEIHFAAEEGPGGLFAAMGQRMSAATTALRSQHGAFRRQIARLRRSVEPSMTPATADQLREVSALIAELRAHEAAEEEALQDVFALDLGNGD